MWNNVIKFSDIENDDEKQKELEEEHVKGWFFCFWILFEESMLQNFKIYHSEVKPSTCIFFLTGGERLERLPPTCNFVVLDDGVCFNLHKTKPLDVS